MRSRVRDRRFIVAIAALLLIVIHGPRAEASSKKAGATTEITKPAIEKKAGSVERVTFPDTGWSPVKVVRGNATANSNDPQAPKEKAETAEIVTFDGAQHSSVRVMRGETDRRVMVSGQPGRAGGMNLEIVGFAGPAEPTVSILRGAGSHLVDSGLFGPGSAADLDRVAFAVDGAESSHGADLGMWCAEPSGPQGPMQVTAAAAIDVGGGDRFDLDENRALGRAYLVSLYRRYGNWPDAIAAYNWGPGNLDNWITGGRVADKLPLQVEQYRDRVLREASGESSAAGGRDRN